MTREQFMSEYWKYYIMLEQEVVETFNFVELGQDSVYSNKFAMLLQTIGSELDCVFKVFCGIPQSNHSTIADYAEYILNSWPKIRDQKVIINGRRIVLQPFMGWDKNRAKQSLVWWQGYDDIKHSRVINYAQANQLNTLNLLAALYMIEMKLIYLICDGERPDIPEQPSNIFDLENWDYRYIPLSEGFAVVDGAVSMVNTKKVQWQ